MNRSLHENCLSRTISLATVSMEKNPSLWKCNLDKYLNTKVGCWPKWYSWPAAEFPACSNISQIRLIEKKALDISYYYDLEAITRTTSCLPPCEYREFKLALDSDIFSGMNYSGVGLTFVDNKMSVDKEIEIYSLISLVSDIGGGLGLFLGFSFLMIWDGVALVVGKCFKVMNKGNWGRLNKLALTI